MVVLLKRMQQYILYRKVEMMTTMTSPYRHVGNKAWDINVFAVANSSTDAEENGEQKRRLELEFLPF